MAGHLGWRVTLPWVLPCPGYSLVTPSGILDPAGYARARTVADHRHLATPPGGYRACHQTLLLAVCFRARETPADHRRLGVRCPSVTCSWTTLGYPDPVLHQPCTPLRIHQYVHRSARAPSSRLCSRVGRAGCPNARSRPGSRGRNNKLGSQIWPGYLRI